MGGIGGIVVGKVSRDGWEVSSEKTGVGLGVGERGVWVGVRGGDGVRVVGGSMARARVGWARCGRVRRGGW